RLPGARHRRPGHGFEAEAESEGRRADDALDARSRRAPEREAGLGAARARQFEAGGRGGAFRGWDHRGRRAGRAARVGGDRLGAGWAPVGPTGKPADKPSMIIGALGDIALTPKDLAEEYAASPSGTRFVEIADAGHNSFTDLCSVIRGGGGLV